MDKHTVDLLGMASSVHGPGRSVANTYLTPDTGTTVGGVIPKVHRPELSSGDALEMLAQQTPLNAIARTVDTSARGVRTIVES